MTKSGTCPSEEKFQFTNLPRKKTFFAITNGRHLRLPAMEKISHPGGRPRYQWTAQTSRQLINLTVHSNIKFDDIATAMKDKDGKGPRSAFFRFRLNVKI